MINGDYEIEESEVSLIIFREKDSGELFALVLTLVSVPRTMKYFSVEFHIED